MWRGSWPGWPGPSFAIRLCSSIHSWPCSSSASLITTKYPQIQFDISRDSLVGANKKYHQNFLRFKKEFPPQDDLVVVVESETGRKTGSSSSGWARSWRRRPIFSGTFFTRATYKMMGAKALLFAPGLRPGRACASALRITVPFIAAIHQHDEPGLAVRAWSTLSSAPPSRKNAENDSLVKALPALERIVQSSPRLLASPGHAALAGITALFNPAGEEADQQIYITFDNGRIYLVTAQAPTEDLNGAAVERMRAIGGEKPRPRCRASTSV